MNVCDVVNMQKRKCRKLTLLFPFLLIIYDRLIISYLFILNPCFSPRIFTFYQ